MSNPSTARRRQPSQEAYARDLFECTLALGDRASNAVLEVLDAHQAPRCEEKYPPGRLRFGGNRWRAYYHCHPAPSRPDPEHGHFHVFCRVDDTDGWTHIAGLSMDGMGQPVCLFAVNRWVTGGCWQRAAETARCLDYIPADGGLLLIERWLMSLLGLYQPDLRNLLRRRDQALDSLRGLDPQHIVLDDRSVYQLAATPVDLHGRLSVVLGGEDPHRKAAAP